MKNRYFIILSMQILIFFNLSCGVKVDPNKNYKPTFRQDGAKIYVKTTDIPEALGETSCRLYALGSGAPPCNVANVQTSNGDTGFYCRLYGFEPPAYINAKDVTNNGSDNKEFFVTTMREKGNTDSLFSNGDNLYGYRTMSARLTCFGLTFDYFGRKNYNVAFEEIINFNPDLSYIKPIANYIINFQAITASSVELKISAVSDVAIGVLLQRSLDQSTWIDIANLTNIQSDYSGYNKYYAHTDTGLLPNTTYYYRATSYTSNVSGDPSSVKFMTTLSGGGGGGPTAPSDLTFGLASSSTTSLIWTDNSNDETGFEIERSDDGFSGWTNITTTGANTTSYTDTGLAASTTYYYRLRAINSSGNSSYSGVASNTTIGGGCTAPFDPMSLNLFLIGGSQINLTWMDTAIDETGYEVERSTTSAVAGFSTIATLGPNLTTYSDTGLAASTTYYYQVKAVKTGCPDSGYTPVQSEATP